MTKPEFQPGNTNIYIGSALYALSKFAQIKKENKCYKCFIVTKRDPKKLRQASFLKNVEIIQFGKDVKDLNGATGALSDEYPRENKLLILFLDVEKLDVSDGALNNLSNLSDEVRVGESFLLLHFNKISKDMLRTFRFMIEPDVIKKPQKPPKKIEPDYTLSYWPDRYV
jgi:hypothetical protein